MHAFWLVLTYDLLKDRHIDDVIIKNLFLILYYIKQIDSKDKSGHDMKYEETYMHLTIQFLPVAFMGGHVDFTVTSLLE